jgi:hypothetical protein
LAASGSAVPVDRRHDNRPTALSARFVGLALLGGLAELALLALWQRNGYWDFSDGVYAASARQLLHGLAPYRDFAAAQPPPVYLFGALLLAVHDRLVSLRAGLGLVDLATAALVAVSVWRLSGRRWLAVAAGAGALLLPISLHEHAQLTPETLAAPLLLAGALWCARPARAAAGGLLLALAAACKLAFVIPALAIGLASPARRRATVTLLASGASLGGLSLAIFGTGEWREAVQAQLQLGRASLHYASGLLTQGAWNELPLVLGAAPAVWLAWRDAEEVHERELVRTLAAAAAGGLVLALTVLKRGSYINVLGVAEPPLLVLAACGAAWSWERWRPGRALVVALAALLAAQSISLLASPGDPWAAKRPGAQSGLAWSASPAAVDRAVSLARRCSRRRAYSGNPYIAFLAARRMPGYQPDVFVLQHARVDASFATRAALDQPRCPPG